MIMMMVIGDGFADFELFNLESRGCLEMWTRGSSAYQLTVTASGPNMVTLVIT